MIEVVDHVVPEVVVEGGRRRLRDVPDRDRVAIRRGPGDARHADRAAGAADILDEHGLAERPAHRFGDETRHRIGRAAGRRRHDERDRLGRKGRLRCRHLRRGRMCEHKCACDKRPKDETHGYFLHIFLEPRAFSWTLRHLLRRHASARNCQQRRRGC